jgi:DNA-binding transcriptional LysR family regulator
MANAEDMHGGYRDNQVLGASAGAGLSMPQLAGQHGPFPPPVRASNPMLDWDDLRYFLAVHRNASLARAASALGINATTVGRRLAALEERLEARLFDRTPDGYTLTPTGRDLVARAEAIEAETFAIERHLMGADQRPAGIVRVTATETLATRFIMPHLPRFRATRPEITLVLECTNRTVSLARRQADVALRLARPREDGVVTRRLAAVHLALYGAVQYLDARGMPEDPETTLAGHDVILFADSRAFTIENEWYEPRIARARVAMRSDSVSSIYAAAVAGVGLALLPGSVADRDSALRRVPTASSRAPREIWQAVHADLQKNARVRAVLDFLAEILATSGLLKPRRRTIVCVANAA